MEMSLHGNKSNILAYEVLSYEECNSSSETSSAFFVQGVSEALTTVSEC